jgi:hypothetical protein
MKNNILLFCMILPTFFSCKKEDTEPGSNGMAPEAALLIFPYNHSACNEGTEVTATASIIHFEWMAGKNSDRYELMLTNLESGEESLHAGTETILPVELIRGNRYSWYVLSFSSDADDTARSHTWQFFSEGDGIETHPPFPAEIIFPQFAQIIENSGGTISLSWTGSDLDNDILSYTVYFGTESPPALLQSDIQLNSLNDIPVEPGTAYYWRVITTDSTGNTSDSGIFQFKIQ